MLSAIFGALALFSRNAKAMNYRAEMANNKVWEAHGDRAARPIRKAIISFGTSRK